MPLAVSGQPQFDEQRPCNNGLADTRVDLKTQLMRVVLGAVVGVGAFAVARFDSRLGNVEQRLDDLKGIDTQLAAVEERLKPLKGLQDTVSELRVKILRLEVVAQEIDERDR